MEEGNVQHPQDGGKRKRSMKKSVKKSSPVKKVVAISSVLDQVKKALKGKKIKV